MQSNTKIPAREVRRQLMNYLPLCIFDSRSVRVTSADPCVYRKPNTY
jgi:hypothetical protein